MIRSCSSEDVPVIDAIINEAANAYRGVIPPDCWHEPYMKRSELIAEIASGVEFSGWHEQNDLLGIMGLQRVRDVSLIRHAYVRPKHQGQGIGRKLIERMLTQATMPVLVGTWAAASWAIRFYERQGFRLVSEKEKDRLLDSYWNIPLRQRETSVVLRHKS